MLEVTLKRTTLGKVEYKGQMVDSVRHEWLFDGKPVHVCIAQPDYLVRGKKLELFLGIDAPESPDFQRYKLLSMDGYNINSVGIVRTDPERLFGSESIEDVTTFFIDETKSQLDLFSVTLTLDGLGNCRSEETMLREYLERKKDAEQPESAS